MRPKKIIVPTGTMFLLKGFVFLLTFYFLYEAILIYNPHPETWFSSFKQIWRQGEGLTIGLAIILVFFNWGFEARKWQLLASKVETISFGQAYQAVLAGICLGFITPNRLGDYAGRILALKSRKRIMGLGAVFLGRFCQLTITVALGSVGVFYFLVFYFTLTLPILVSIACTLLLINAALALLFFRPQIIISGLSVVPYVNRYVGYLAVMTIYSPAELRKLLQLSVVRYFVFVGQYVLLLKAFGVTIAGWVMALGVSGTFLLKSVVPSFSALSDLGMRELSALYFFSLLDQNKLMVISASICLWFINIAIPSLVGLLYVWRVKWQIIDKRKKVKSGK